MGNLMERSCDNCKNLFEAISIGVCEKTKHKVERVGDSEKALTCEHYVNKYYPEKPKER